MNKAQQLPLYLKIYQLIKMLNEVIRNFPRYHKYILGEEMIKLAWQCLDLVLEANSLPNEEKSQKISELSLVFDKLKLRLRMSQELNLVSKNQYAHLQTNYSMEIGKMIGAWLKWANTLKQRKIA